MMPLSPNAAPLPRPRHGDALGAVGAAAVAGVFGLGLLWRDPLLCWRDDFAISILPVFTDIARAWRAGEWPLLSPGSWVCGNLAGEYQYGTFSPVVNLAALFADALPVSLPAKAAALALPHVALTAAGSYLLARQRSLRPGLALVVGSVGALNGWNIAWGATDWFGALAANAWLPWCWWAFEGALAPGETRFTRRALAPALTVFGLLTGGFPYTVGMLGVVTAWLGVRTWVQTRRWLAPWPLAAGWAAGLALSAPAWLSLLELMTGSDRARGAHVVGSAWVVPWRALAGFVDPSWTVPWADFAARMFPRPALELAGALVPLALLAAGLWAGRGRALRRAAGDLGLTAVSLALCLLPSVGVFRWSFRWLPLFHLSLAMTAVEAASVALLQVRRVTMTVVDRRAWLGPGAWVAGLSALAWVGSGGTLAVQTLALGLAWAVAGRYLPSHRLRRWLPAGAVLGTLWLTYGTMGTNPGVPHYPFTDNQRERGPLSPERLYLSLYREPYLHYTVAEGAPGGFGATLRPGSTMLFAPGLQFINGYSPIMAAGIGRRLEMETHGFVPEGAARRVATEELGPEGLLARLGVDGLIVATGLPFEVRPPAGEWELAHEDAEGRVYHRRGGPTPELRALGAAGGTMTTVRMLTSGRQEVSAEVTATPGEPVTVALRRPFFPGWRATLEGREVPVSSAEGLFPTVTLPAGAGGRLTWRYRPRAVVWGVALALVGVATLGVAAACWRRAR